MNSFDSQSVNYLVGTLNFSAEIISPYEFHSQENADNQLFEFQLNDSFKKFASKEYPSFDNEEFDWGMSAIDLAWKNRYCPFYKLECGVNSNGSLMTEQEFLEEWDRQLETVKERIIDERVEKLIIKGSKLPREELAKNQETQINACRCYDLLGYKAFVEVIYGIEDISNIDVKADKYLSERKKHFERIYVNNEYKKDKAVEFIREKDYDIFCFQECDAKLINSLRVDLKEYIVVEMPNKLNKICDSIILLKKAKFVGHDEKTIENEREKFLAEYAEIIKSPQKFTKKLSLETVNYINEKMEKDGTNDDIEKLKLKIHQELFWNDDTCYCVISDLIVFSPHISTKKNLNEAQINEIKESITKILTYFPEKFFICAGDLNGNFENQLNLRTSDHKFIKINAFPWHDDDITCKKMRTLTQAQRAKALDISFRIKDFIITDLKIVDPVVELINGTQVSKKNAPLTPNDKHPYDHFVVSGTVRMMDRVVSSSPLLKKRNLTKPFESFQVEPTN